MVSTFPLKLKLSSKKPFMKVASTPSTGAGLGSMIVHSIDLFLLNSLLRMP